jgi:hypothetical protein
MNDELVLATQSSLGRRIFTIRGQQVMLDHPPEFRFQLTEEECERILRSQFATSSGHGGRRYLPYAFTEQGVYFDGQIFDAYVFINDLLRQAKHSILLIDNYVDDSTLVQLDKRAEGVTARILTHKISKALAQDVAKHNQQYPPIELHEFAHSHDRFLILDGAEVYHLGASLKDLGKKWFAFTRLEASGLTVMGRLKEVGYGG